jgi:hypothetical protein
LTGNSLLGGDSIHSPNDQIEDEDEDEDEDENERSSRNSSTREGSSTKVKFQKIRKCVGITAFL